MSVLVEMAFDEAAAYQEAWKVFEDVRLSRIHARRAVRYDGVPRDQGLEHDYCVARHNMMVALRDFEWREEAAANTAIRMASYMNVARLPPKLDFDDVLYYIDHRGGVHIFYGGGLSPTGYGNSPDGRRHGHIKLSPRRSRRGGYDVAYRRKPG
ncbi:MAG TPA: hypothetical protein VLH14_01375 [Patescibacteria group bacterium]|nr:hypothetical protein [Patescibacteria group bacterium]